MDLRQLVRAFDGGRIDADTLVWRKGMPDWRRLRDVPELAERLMGPEAAAKATAVEAPIDADPGMDPPRLSAAVRQNSAAVRQNSAAPRQNPRQAERSRTPPANYGVNDREQAAEARSSASEQKDGTPSSEPVATMPGASAVPQTPAGGYGSPEPPRAKPADRRAIHPGVSPAGVSASPSDAAGSESENGSSFGAVQHAPRLTSAPSVISAKSGSTQMGLSAAGLSSTSGVATPGVAPAEQRTITQTGLAPAPEAGTRASLSPVQHGNSGLQAASEAEVDAARASLSAPSPSPRNVRSATPAPGARRRASSDETPAQKPASISVSSSALAQASARPRPKHLVALGGLLLGAGALMMVRVTQSTDSSVSVPASASERQAAIVPAELPRIEKSAPLPLEPVPEPKPATPQINAPAASPSPTLAPAKAAAADATTQSPARLAHNPAPPVVAPAVVHPPSKPAPVPAPAANAPRLDVRAAAPQPPVSPNAEPPLTGRAEIAAPAVPPPAPAPEPAAPARTVPPPAVAPSTASPAQSAPSQATPAQPVPAQPVPAQPTPAAFDDTRAREQMGLAAFKASTCNQLGDTRGSGQVNVVVQSWGRVVRVTHLNQAFVGTPVGLCIMEAFQQVQVPPFEGGPRTLVGSFLVQ